MKFSNTKSKEKFIKNIFKKILLIFLILSSLYFTITSNSKKEENIENKKSLDIANTLYSTISYPFKAIYNLLSNIEVAFSSIDELKKTEEELWEKELELQKMKWLEAENLKLKEMLNFQKTQKHTTISANISSDNSSNFSKSIIINSGSENGVEKYQGVISKNSLIGFINDVSEKSSRVILATDPVSKIPVIIEFSGNRAILAGNNSKNPELKFVEKNNEIEIGDKIITSGFENKIPKGILVGYIEYISENKISVKLENNINKLEYIKVITNIYEENINSEIENNEN